MHAWLAVALLTGLAATAAAQPRHGNAAGAYAVYGTPPSIAAGHCDRGNGMAPTVAGLFGESADRACLGLVLEYAHDRQWVNWTSGRGETLSVSPMRTYESSDGFCRDFLAISVASAPPALRTACRDASGRWNLMGATEARAALPGH